MKPGQKPYQTATPLQVLHWFQEGIYTLQEDQVYKGDKRLTQRLNTRRGSERGDARVDLWHNNWRRSCHVSTLVWMVNTGRVIPDGFEIHHLDENPENNSFPNLVAVHSLDHLKLHGQAPADDGGFDEDIPF